jgi:hypothetical protein
MRAEIQTAAALRRELSGRNLERAAAMQHEVTYGAVPSVVYAADEMGGHGNFLPAAFRRICAEPTWRARLEKSYTASARVPRAGDRQRKELDCATSSDALLMNVFCYPRLLSRPAICSLLHIEPGLRPEFGVRARLPMRNGEVDRTELDMTLGSGDAGLLFEAKLTEGGFQTASIERVLRYEGIAEIFDIDELPRTRAGVEGYQLIRGVLAAEASGGRFVLLCDRRRADLEEIWFRVLRAVRRYDLRSRMALLTWQEIAAAVPPTVKEFLEAKYGIMP